MKQPAIYVSSLAMIGKSMDEMIRLATDNNLAIEFSSGIPFGDDVESKYLNAKVVRMPHNYFPAPRIPFVLNLASTNNGIRNQSIGHCRNGLMLAAKSNAPFFSAHAGFCVDPDPGELGKKIKYDPTFDREANRLHFIKSVRDVLQTADELGVDFLIENNVLAPFNVVQQNVNPLLCCESHEIKWLFDEIRHPRLHLLLDTAHLKVSCQTLGLDVDKETSEVLPFVKAVHHSDNNGKVDDNQPMGKDYWFLPFMKNTGGAVHVVEVKNIGVESILNQINLLLRNGY